MHIHRHCAAVLNLLTFYSFLFVSNKGRTKSKNAKLVALIRALLRAARGVTTCLVAKALCELSARLGWTWTRDAKAARAAKPGYVGLATWLGERNYSIARGVSHSTQGSVGLPSLIQDP